MGKKGGGGGGGNAGSGDDAADLAKFVKKGDVDKVEALLQKDRKLAQGVNKKGQPMLVVAVVDGGGDDEVLEALLQAGAKPNAADAKGMTALHHCMLEENDLCAVALVKAGAKLDAKDGAGETPIHLAARLATDMAQRIAEILLTPSEFAEASDGGCVLETDVAKALAATDKNGATPLHVAASEPDSEFAAFLLSRLEHIKSPKDLQKAINAQAVAGTPLHQACAVGNVPVALKLLELGADCTAVAEETGHTILHDACMDGTMPIVKAVLKARGDAPEFVNAKAGDGSTALHFAAMNGHYLVAELLANLDGVELNAADEDGSTPVVVAWENGHSKVVGLLESKGVETAGLDEAKAAQKAVRQADHEAKAAKGGPVVERDRSYKNKNSDARKAKREAKEAREAGDAGSDDGDYEDEAPPEDMGELNRRIRELQAEERWEKEAEAADRMDRAMQKRRGEKAGEPQKYTLNFATVLIMVGAFTWVAGMIITLRDYFIPQL